MTELKRRRPSAFEDPTTPANKRSRVIEVDQIPQDLCYPQRRADDVRPPGVLHRDFPTNIGRGFAPGWTKRKASSELVQNLHDGALECLARLQKTHGVSGDAVLKWPMRVCRGIVEYACIIGRAADLDNNHHDHKDDNVGDRKGDRKDAYAHESQGSKDSKDHKMDTSSKPGNRADPPFCLAWIRWSPRDRTLVLTNKGTDLTAQSLYLGATDKQAVDPRMAGQFGSGLKRALCHLVAADKDSVDVVTHGEHWTFGYGPDKRFAGRGKPSSSSSSSASSSSISRPADDIEILIVDQTHMPTNWREFETRITVTGLTDHDVHFGDFLFLQPDHVPCQLSPGVDPSACAVGHVPFFGRLLVQDHLRGHVYLKGFLLAQCADLSIGVDLARLTHLSDARELSRDGHTQVMAIMGLLWADAVHRGGHGPDSLCARAYAALADPDQADRYQDLRIFARTTRTAEAAAQLWQRFTQLHGDRALPVAAGDGPAQALLIEGELGRPAIVCTRQLYDALALAPLRPSVEQLRATRFRQMLTTPAPRLDAVETAAWDQLCALVAHVFGADIAAKLVVKVLRAPAPAPVAAHAAHPAVQPAGPMAAMAAVAEIKGLPPADAAEVKGPLPAQQAQHLDNDDPVDCVNLQEDYLLVHVELLDVDYVHRVYGRDCLSPADCTCPLAVVIDVVGKTLSSRDARRHDRAFIQKLVQASLQLGRNAWYPAPRPDVPPGIVADVGAGAERGPAAARVDPPPAALDGPDQVAPVALVDQLDLRGPFDVHGAGEDDDGDTAMETEIQYLQRLRASVLDRLLLLDA